MKRAFTLVEIVLVVIISAILFVLLGKVYILASNLYVYHSNLKHIESDVLFFNQTLQNLVDKSELDFSKYSDLSSTDGFTGKLFLKAGTNKFVLYAQSGQIILDKNGNKIPLTNTWFTKVDKLIFKILPYHNPYKIFTPENRQPYVEVFLSIRNRFYTPWDWAKGLKVNLQEGFNFKYYNN